MYEKKRISRRTTHTGKYISIGRIALDEDGSRNSYINFLLSNSLQLQQLE